MLATLENAALNRLATVRMLPPQSKRSEPIVVDLLFASCGIEVETVREAEPIVVFKGLSIPVAQVPHLIAMKVLSERRERRMDTVDLYGLLRVASDDEVARARELIDLITGAAMPADATCSSGWIGTSASPAPGDVRYPLRH